MKVAKPKAATVAATPAPPRSVWFVVLLAVILAGLFWKSFLPGYVHFSNDGPLAQVNAAANRMPAALTGVWFDANGIGSSAGAPAPGVTSLLSGVLGPVGFSKFLAPIAMFILGLGAWTFFRQLKLSPWASMLGGLAAALQSAWFSNACWGVASQQIAVGMTYFALALVVSNTPETPRLVRCIRLILAGFAVGMNVMEGADNGVIFSLLVAAFILVRSLLEEGTPVWSKLGRGVARIAVVAVCAAFIAAQAIEALVGVAIVNVGSTQQTPEAQVDRWNFSTQWSLPKVETLSLFVPGLFGYRMVPDGDQASKYWGAIGRAAAWDPYFASGGKGTAPDEISQMIFLRQTGGGNYQGIVLAIVAIWAAAQAFRRRNPVFSEPQRRFIWFFSALGVVAIVLAWGRFGPFNGYPYRWLFELPHGSSFRNPTKFVSIFSWALVVLFAYGVDGLSRRYLQVPAANLKSTVAQLQNWWAGVRGFDRRWALGCCIALAAGVLGWLMYGAQKPALVNYLKIARFSEDMAKEIAAFSIAQAGWFLVFFGLAMGLVVLIIAGAFSGRRAWLGGSLLGLLLVVDLVRADRFYVMFWDYPQKYQSNPIVDFLRDKPYEHRVIVLPFRAAPNLPMYDNYWKELYDIEWIQQLFPYYNIQSLDYVMNPRPAADSVAFEEALLPSGTFDSLYLVARKWALSNNRYFLGTVAIQLPQGNVDTLSFLNDALDPAKKRFRIVQRFDIVPKAGLTDIQTLEEMTAVSNDNGACALFEFGGALPRAKLYSNWETNSLAALKDFTTNGLSERDLGLFNNVGTNDFLILKKLASPAFDPWQTVLMSDPSPLPPTGTNQEVGRVEFKSYAPKKIVLATEASTPTLLLLNDKYDPQWRVTVDGNPTPLHRANFIMRGVYLPAGAHTVKFQFNLPSRPLYVTLAAIAIAFCLLGVLYFITRKSPPSVPEPKAK
jgi:hypothetical protein